jgi:hypothetical protein
MVTTVAGSTCPKASMQQQEVLQPKSETVRNELIGY